MNSIYIEAQTILSNKPAVEWLDECGAKWVLCDKFSECRKSVTEELNKKGNYVWFNHRIHPKVFSYGRAEENATHCQTPEQFCELIAEILGIDKPVFVEVNDHSPDIRKKVEAETKPNGIAIEVSRLSEEDKQLLIEWLPYVVETMLGLASRNTNWANHVGFGDSFGLASEKWYKNNGYTITEDPKVFMEYVAKQTGKEYKPLNNHSAQTTGATKDDVGIINQLNRHDQFQSSNHAIGSGAYPHKTYRILDSLDGIPLDKRFKLSEWIPPFQKDVLFIVKGKMFIGHIWKLQESIIALGGSNELIKDLDGEWMRIV